MWITDLTTVHAPVVVSRAEHVRGNRGVAVQALALVTTEDLYLGLGLKRAFDHLSSLSEN